MRRQTLSMIPIILVALAVTAGSFYGYLRTTHALENAAWLTVTAQGLTLDLPADRAVPQQDPGDPWSATEFRAGTLGRLRIARERPQGELAPALRNWFALPGALDRPFTYQIHGQPAQARPVTAFGPSGYLIRREGRQWVAVCVFDLGGSRYWVQARSPGASRAALAGFHRVLLSLRGPDGAGVDPLLAGQLRAAERELARGIVQEERLWLFFIPVVGMGGMVALVLAIAGWSGRAPRTPEALGARYFQAPVEVFIAYKTQRKFFDAAIAVLDDRLVVYTFGTPFLTLPLADLRGKVTPGAGWFPPPYLEIAIEGSQYFHKVGLYRTMMARARLRIYTEDVLRLRTALGA